MTEECHEFLLREGRLPRLGSESPWEYRGWLLPYVQMAEMALRGEESRWAYQLELIETGRLPARGIPKIRFGEMDRRVYRELEKWVDLAGLSRWSNVRTFLDWLLWGLALTREEPRVGEAEKLYRAVDLGPMLQSPYDYFGYLIAERGVGHTSFFPTPHAVCECMVAMMFCGGEGGGDTRGLTVNEPCLGTGRMLLHASNYSLRLSGQDIDGLVLAAARVNGALYAPWMSYGTGAVFERADSAVARELWFDAVTAEYVPAPVAVSMF